MNCLRCSKALGENIGHEGAYPFPLSSACLPPPLPRLGHKPGGYNAVGGPLGRNKLSPRMEGGGGVGATKAQ